MLTPEDRERIALAIEAKAKGEWEGFQDGLKYAAAFVRALPAESPWVRVEDRLPEPREYVLFFSAENGGMRLCGNNCYGSSFMDSGEDIHHDVTHWMPLPDPPEPAPCPSTPSA